MGAAREVFNGTAVDNVRAGELLEYMAIFYSLVDSVPIVVEVPARVAPSPSCYRRSRGHRDDAQDVHVALGLLDLDDVRLDVH